MTEYRRIGSFDRSRIDAVGAGESSLAVASGNRITLVSGTDRSAFEHGEPITDIAMDDRLVVLSSNRLTAYTRDGARVWNRTFDSPHAITTVHGEPIVGVLEPDRMRTVDLETGQESATIERRRPGRPRDDLFIGIEGGFVSSTWSFLRCVDATGEERFDRNLNTAIRAIGSCGDTLVAALQNGRLKGFDVRTGERRWETELPVRQIPPGGDDVLLFSTDDGVKSIGPDGSIDSIDSLPGGDVYASTDGSVVCSVRDGSVGVHVPDEELIDAEILTDSVGVGGTIDLSVTNLGSTEHDVALEANLEHADLSPAKRHLELAPRDPTRTDFPVESVRTDGETEFTVGIEDRTVATRSIEVSDAAQSTVAAEAELHPVGVSVSGAKLDLSVENTGTIPLDSISVLETGEEGSDIDPGETWSRTITKPYEPGRTITVGMEVIRGNRRTELAPTCRLPEQPTIELEQKRDALHGRISADEEVVWSDELVIEAPGADRVRSPVEIQEGSMLVVLPLYEAGIARIGLSKLGVSERARMSDQGPLADLTGSSDRGNRTTERSGPAGETNERSAAAFDTDQKRDRASREGSSQTKAQNGDGDRTTEAPGGTDKTGVSIVREVSDRSVPVGHAVRERLVVENGTSDVVEPTVAVGKERIEPGAVTPDGTWTGERRFVFFSADGRDRKLPEATVSVEGDTLDRAPAESVSVTDRNVRVRGVVDPDGRYELEFENSTGSDRRITGLEIDDRPTDTETRTLQSGDRTTITGTVDAQLHRSDSAVPVTAFVTDADGSSGAIETLAAVRDRSDGSSGSADGLEKRIGSSTQVAGEYGTVVFVFENDGREAVSDVTIQATGDPINDMLYSQAHRETLSPGERIEHYVDLKTEAGPTAFDVAASYTTESDGERSETLRVAGPAVETEAEWTDEHRTSWTFETVSGGSGGSFDVPEPLSTEFRA